MMAHPLLLHPDMWLSTLCANINPKAFSLRRAGPTADGPPILPYKAGLSLLRVTFLLIGAATAACGSNSDATLGGVDAGEASSSNGDAGPSGATDGGGTKAPLDGSTQIASAEVLADNLPQPRGIAVDDTTLFWNSEEDDPTVGGGHALYSMPKGGGPSTYLAATLNDPQQIVVDSATVYWVEGFGEKILWAPKTGGTANQTSAAFGVVQIALQGSTLYFNDECGIDSAPTANLNTNSILVQSTYEANASFAFDATKLFWICATNSADSTLNLMFAGLDGSNPKALTTISGNSASLQVDDVALYVARREIEPGDGVIWRVDRTTGAATTLAQGIQFGSLAVAPNIFAIDDANVYWFDQAKLAIFSVKKDGSGAPVMMASTSCTPYALIADSSFLYVACPGTAHAKDGKILRVAK